LLSARVLNRINRNISQNTHNSKTMISVVPAQCLGHTAKKLLVWCTGFNCYSTLRRWVYAKCRPVKTVWLSGEIKLFIKIYHLHVGG